MGGSEQICRGAIWVGAQAYGLAKMGRTLVPLAARLAEAFCRENETLHDRQQAQCSEDDRKRREKAREQAK